MLTGRRCGGVAAMSSPSSRMRPSSGVSKPAITRALDRLGELDLARRKVDPADRRSVLVQRTLKGTAFLRDLRGIMGEAAGTAKKAETGKARAAG